jgi:fatty-acyl-CoA synthase
VLDHHRVIWCGLNIALLVGIREGDRIIHVAPLYHSAELNVFLMAGTMLSCTHVVLPAFEPGIVLDTLVRERITHFFGVPTMFQFLLRQPDLARRDLSTLRVGMYGAAPMPPTTVQELIVALPHLALYNLCGLTEAGPGGIVLGPEDQLRKLGAGGKALPHTEARVVDEQMRDVAPGVVGELVLKGESVMKGYWNMPEATAEAFRDGWLLTGDLATIDEEGYISLVDRKKDMIITGGMNVYCIEVENAVQAHPGILDCAVIGVPHPDYGETVVAVVTLKPNTTLTLEELREHCQPLIADYKIPRRLVIDAVPRNASGKILKYQLRERLMKDVGA